jgi:NAD(P)-dependent dehydrogenase (short-subunit alcohol dehydrogenase family)
MPVFRDDLLNGRRVAFAGGGGVAILAELGRLGAWVETLDLAEPDDDAVTAWVTQRAPLHALVFDATQTFASGGERALQASLERAWISARAVATGALIPAGEGRLLFAAPRPDAGPHAEAARAGLENLARTLSVEWARFGVTAVTICPGSQTTEAEIAELVCFLLSEAGGYFSGCRFDLGAVETPGAFIPGS